MSKLYFEACLTTNIHIPIVNIGGNIKETIERIVKARVEGKCIVEGYIKTDSVQIVSFSNGMIKGDHIEFVVTYQCLVCNPVEGMNISCIAKNITKAGIRAVSIEEPSPVMVFVSRDHHNTNKYFNEVKENDKITVRIIGQRFELNDKCIYIIAELHEPKKILKVKKKIQINDGKINFDEKQNRENVEGTSN